MSIYEVFDKLQQEVENAASVPLTSKVMIDKDLFLDLLDELKELLPNNQYSYNVVLTRLGTDSPDGSLVEGACGVTVSIKGWTKNSSTVII